VAGNSPLSQFSFHPTHYLPSCGDEHLCGLRTQITWPTSDLACIIQWAKVTGIIRANASSTRLYSIATVLRLVEPAVTLTGIFPISRGGLKGGKRGSDPGAVTRGSALRRLLKIGVKFCSLHHNININICSIELK